MRKSAWCGIGGGALALAFLVGCGGGGGSADASTTTTPVTTPGASFSPGSSSEQAYFSDSYEFIGASSFGVRGYVHNAAGSTGDLNRTGYANTSGTYSAITTLYTFQLGYLGSVESQILDPWVLSSQGNVRNESSGSYLLKFSGADWFSIKDVQEVDIAGQPFGAYLSATALGGVSGTFPAGSKAYTATWVAKQDIYLASNVGSVFARTASAHYFLDYYNTSSQAYCLSQTRGLVFDSLTHATSYPLLARAGTSCTVDTTGAGTSHSVSSHQVGNTWFFDFTNNQTQLTDFVSNFFGVPGVSTQMFALVLDGGVAGQVTEHGNAYVHPANSQGSYMATSGVRLNKVAVNAVLAASSLPAVP